MRFSCSVCGQSVAMVEVHAWSFDAALCSAACVARAAPRPAPSPAHALAAALASIERASALALECHRGLGRVQSAQREAAAASSVGARFLLGGILGALASGAADDYAERALGRQEDVRWELEQRLVQLARELMALHGLGFPIAAQMPPLFTDFGTLAPAGAAGSGAQLASLRGYLDHLAGGVRTWIG